MKVDRRRALLTLGTVLPAGLVLSRLGRSQGFSQAPLAPPEARGNLEHRFWRDILEEFPLEPNESYFDTADHGIPPLQTLDRMHETATQLNAFAVSRRDDPVPQVRATAAQFLGAQPEDLALLCSATHAMMAVAMALPLRPGATVAISSHEPPSSLIPWVGLARAGRVQLRPFVPRLPWKSWRDALDGAAALVVSHVLPTSGEILPLQEITHHARRKKTWVIANGSYAAGIIPVVVSELDVDAYVTSGSGFLLGPRGTALLYVRDALRSHLLPAARRVDGLDSATQPQKAGIETAADLELEEPDASRAAGLSASLDWLSAFGLDVVREHATTLAGHLVEGVRDIAGVELLSTDESVTACPIVGIRVTKRPYTQVTEWLRDELSVRVHPVATPGLNSVRATPYLVNRKSDVETLIEGMRRLAYV